MKKTSIIFILTLVIVLAGSCISERHLIPEERNVADDCDSVTIMASLEQGITKTSLGDNLDVIWKTGDKIIVYNDATPNGKVFTLDDDSDGKKQGTFSGPKLSGSGPYYAVYPAEIAGTLSGNSVSIDVNPIQNVAKSGTFGAGANISAAISADITEFFFKNVCGLLAITLQGAQSVEQIRLTADGDELLSGSGCLTLSPTEVPILELTSGSRSVTLNMSGSNALSPEGTTFYIVVPAGSLASGFAVEIADSEGGAMVKHAADDGYNRVERATVKPMPVLTYAADVNRAWLDYTQPGVYSGLAPGQTLSSKIIWHDNDGQYAWGPNMSSPFMFCIEDWDAEYAVSLFLKTSSLVLGKPFIADIEAMGTTNGLSSATGVTMKVFKVNNGMIWLSDGTNGFIMKTEEE